MAFTGFSFGMSMAVTVSVMKPMLASDHEKLSKISISGLIYSCTDTCMWSQKLPPIKSRLRSWVDTALWRLWERRRDATSFRLQHDLSSFYTRAHLSVCMRCVYVLLVSAFFHGANLWNLSYQHFGLCALFKRSFHCTVLWWRTALPCLQTPLCADPIEFLKWNFKNGSIRK